jgi:transposase
MTIPFLGIDVSKRKLDCALLLDGKVLEKSCDNSPSGFKQLFDWLAKRKVTQVHLCVEATGGFQDKVAVVFFEAGHAVSVLNPAVVHAFSLQRLARSKTDRIDARLIAEYASRNAMDLRLWEPPPREFTELRDLVNRRQALVAMRTQETNRLKMESGGPVVDDMVKKHLTFLEAQIVEVEKAIRDHVDRHPGLKAQHDLLVSIPGIGEHTAALFLAEVGAKLREMSGPKQLVRHAGLDIRRRESGSSVRGRPRMSKVGNSRLRTALFMPAQAAMRFNPVVAAMNERMKEALKAPMVRVGAAMRKLLHLMYGVLKTGRPFNEAHAAPILAGALTPT